MKFSDVEMSRILSAHCGGQLARGGSEWLSTDAASPAFLAMFPDLCCVIQAAKVIPVPMDAWESGKKLARWFDDNYNDEWSAAKLLRKLEKIGAVK